MIIYLPGDNGMKLNNDCVRDILMVLELKTEYNEKMEIQRISFEDFISLPKINTYEQTVVLYASQKLREANYIDFVKHPGPFQENMMTYGSLTFFGHQFLENIREDTIWVKTKAIAADIGSQSLSMLSQIAVGIITELIKSRMAL